MNDVATKFGPVVGRCLIVILFLWSGYGKIVGFQWTVGYMTSKGLPLVQLLAIASIVVELGGALMILLGWKARLGAAALFLWMIPVTYVFHNFWAVPADQQLMQQIMFLKNLGIMGALLYVMAFGSGRYSVDKN